MFNNAEKILNYIKNLKEALTEEYCQLYQEEDNIMISNCLEEIEQNNVNKFGLLLDEKFKILVDMLKNTVR